MRVLVAFLVMAVAAQFAALKADPAAMGFVESIYRNYLQPNSSGVPISKRGELDRYFTPALADLIEADVKAAAKKQEPPLLNGDPFVDAQDWKVEELKIALQDEGPDRAVARVSFRNFGEGREVQLRLARVSASWRVDDIVWSDGSLRALYRKP